MIHGVGKERKEGSSKRSDERVDGNGAIGIEPIAVNQVAHSLPERNHAAETEQGDRKDLWYPEDVRITGPGKPKETNW